MRVVQASRLRMDGKRMARQQQQNRRAMDANYPFPVFSPLTDDH